MGKAQGESEVYALIAIRAITIYMHGVRQPLMKITSQCVNAWAYISSFKYYVIDIHTYIHTYQTEFGMDELVTMKAD